ncbi:hypothetical protein IQ250_15795 [Pseudanabaenaceae cyanobacterium LEGE 13415]|nr:hypothetical protein [Pseudanabaenaceae cyanobacterium LEGE 13415]
MSKGVRTKSQPDDFYQQPCWMDIWLTTFDMSQLDFWSQLDEADAARLLSHLADAGFVIEVKATRTTSLQFRVDSTAYSHLTFYRVQAKPQVPGTLKPQSVQDTLQFRAALQRLWTSMRILQTFTVGQVQACSNVTNNIAQTVVYVLYQIGYLQLISYYPHPYFLGNEDSYQLLLNTGATAPFFCGDGLLFDVNTHCIYQLQKKARL